MRIICTTTVMSLLAWYLHVCVALGHLKLPLSTSTITTCQQHSVRGRIPTKPTVSPLASLQAATTINEDEDDGESSSSSAAAAFIDIPVLYESDRLLIVNKPPGIAHHNDIIPQGEKDEDDDQQEQADVDDASLLGIVNALRKQRRRQQSGDNDDGGGSDRLWGVHRLDRVTSGILIFAKDVAMAQALIECFAEGRIQKVYMGISAKRPTKKKQGWVQGGMVRSRDKSWKLTRNHKDNASTNTKTKTKTTAANNFAKTRFFTAPIRGHNKNNKDNDHDYHRLTLVLFRPYTGKTHQLRVAAKSMGLPLLGDPIYKDGSSKNDSTTSRENNNAAEDIILTPPRTYLHASGILIPPLLDNPESVAVWCPPQFTDVIVQESTDAIAALMRKHCDVLEIVQAMEGSYT